MGIRLIIFFTKERVNKWLTVELIGKLSLTVDKF